MIENNPTTVNPGLHYGKLAETKGNKRKGSITCLYTPKDETSKKKLNKTRKKLFKIFQRFYIKKFISMHQGSYI